MNARHSSGTPEPPGDEREAVSPAVDDAGNRSGSPRVSGRRRGRSLRAQVLIAVMSVLLGIGIVAQVRQTQDDEFAALRQDDLVRLMDEVTERNEQLTEERTQLRRDLAALSSGSGDRQVAEDYARLQAILAGTVPVEGPGIVITVTEGETRVDAQRMVHMLEEMRNAGAEAIAVSGQRLTASSAFVDTVEGVEVDGQLISSPQEWRVIGNAETLAVALDIPGGALASMRTAGATVELVQRDLVQITAVRDVADPEYAVPADPED
ncbi:MAG TPA: DUF881 domain-containing protein [Candidatus Ruania gallistercoris]|uniref:DUF881 domain-containing protein n=1 Tax=Candidatus Ruania gallistercoris TaxID=2838746 RepID=A0A9D2ECZ2_9MICO|nr:DUF881 domain-containing protein [Candidatus Ruania gallistercoris]